MKKLSIFFALLAGIAVMTGCKKDQDAVTFKAVIDQDSKAYFGTSVRPYWDQDDKLRVMGGGYDDTITCSLTGVTQTNATVQGVESSTNHYYCAIYPVEVAEKIGTPDGDDGTTHAVIYYRPDQIYHWDEQNSRQRVNMPMGAVADDATKTFYFKNLCSILRLNVRNTHERPIKITRVTVQASGAYVAGSADVTLTPNGNPQVIMDGLADQADNVLSLYPENNIGFIKELAADGTGSTATIDIVVPPFEATSLNIEFELFEADGTTFIGNSDAIIDNPPALALNKIVTLSLNTNHNVEDPDYAYIESGPEFYAHMRELLTELAQSNGKITSISFNTVESNDRPTSSPNGTIASSIKNVKAAHSAFNIWAYLVHTWGSNYTLEVDCKVPLIYADKDCSYMFADLPDLETMNWNNTARSGFQTEDVVDMSFMFARSPKLRSIQGANFNTTNVRTMAHMFDGCSAFNDDANLNISGFNTHNLQDMEAMFKGCSGLTDIDISNFTTRRVYNMSELFSGCIKIKTVHIDRFDMSGVTNKVHMCQNLGTFGSETIKIYCDDPTWTAIQTGTDLSSNSQHLPPTVSK